MTTPADIAVELGRSAPDNPSAEFSQWEKWIGNAELLIAQRLGDLAALDQDVLTYVVTLAVADHIRRPDSATQVEVAVDDGRVSRRYESSKGRVTILDEWWDLLAPASQSAAFSTRPGFTPDTVLCP